MLKTNRKRWIPPVEFAKQLKENATPSELRIKELLEEASIKYQEQKIIEKRGKKEKGVYIADFYIPNTRTVLEIDGKHHYLDPKYKAKDDIRDWNLSRRGYNIVRIKNREVINLTSESLKQLLTPVPKTSTRVKLPKIKKEVVTEQKVYLDNSRKIWILERELKQLDITYEHVKKQLSKIEEKKKNLIKRIEDLK